MGAALRAEEVQIWTDVTGIMTSDPRIVKNARTIPQISYREAAELAYFGAKVIHPSTIQPAVNLGIPVWVKNTFRPEDQGTKIIPSPAGNGLKAIACKKGITLVNINSSRMLFAYGFLRRIFEIFEKYQTPVDLITTSEVSVSVTIDNPAAVNNIARDLSEIGTVGVESDKAIICLVGWTCGRIPPSWPGCSDASRRRPCASSPWAHPTSTFPSWWRPRIRRTR